VLCSRHLTKRGGRVYEGTTLLNLAIWVSALILAAALLGTACSSGDSTGTTSTSIPTDTAAPAATTDTPRFTQTEAINAVADSLNNKVIAGQPCSGFFTTRDSTKRAAYSGRGLWRVTVNWNNENDTWTFDEQTGAVITISDTGFQQYCAIGALFKVYCPNDDPGAGLSACVESS
jgi:hypothetical protein